MWSLFSMRTDCTFNHAPLIFPSAEIFKGLILTDNLELRGMSAKMAGRLPVSRSPIGKIAVATGEARPWESRVGQAWWQRGIRPLPQPTHKQASDTRPASGLLLISTTTPWDCNFLSLKVSSKSRVLEALLSENHSVFFFLP